MKIIFQAKYMLLGIALLCFNNDIWASKTDIGQIEISLDGLWNFMTDPYNLGEDEKWYSNNFKANSWKKISVPGNWDTQNEYANYRGKVWYKTTFETPRHQNKTILLKFGEVGMSYKVYLNGKKLGTILAGNYEETFDLSNLLNSNDRNVLTVMVDNSLSWGAFWNWGGIRRPVKLLINEAVYIDNQFIEATPDLKQGNAFIKTSVKIRNSTKSEQQISIQQQFYFNGTNVTNPNIQTVAIKPNSIKTITFEEQLSSKQVRLWHFDHPNLYQSRITMLKNNKPIFQHSDRFGIRKIEIDGYLFKLNGENVRLAGYNWVADDRTTGSTLPEFRFKEDIDLMKSAGANMARLSHRPLPQDVMDYLDEKGMLVIAEFNNWPQYMNASSIEPKQFATKLIQQNFNHPSVIGWSVGNENGNLKEFPKVNEYVSSIIKYIKSDLDSSRLVTYVSHTADYQDNDAAQFCDVIMINKYSSFEKGIDNLKIRYPNRSVFMSEYGSHTDNLIYDTPSNSLFKSLMIDNLAQKENLFGYSLWTFNDYRSTYQSPNPYTATPLYQNRQWGIVDVYRNKKKSFRQMQNFYAPIKKIEVGDLKVGSEQIETTIKIIPRSKNDIPAFTLKNYYLVWELRNQENQMEDLSAINLPEIAPSSLSLEFPVTIQKKKSSTSLRVALLSPTGYIVRDTTLFLLPPPSPKVEAFITATNQVRMVFTKNSLASEYVLKYQEEGGDVKVSKPTIDHYIDITSLSFGKKYNFWLVAKNDAGESKASEKYSYVPEVGIITLPPVIWLSEPADKSFFVGIGFHYTDNQYEVRYGQDKTNLDIWKNVKSSSFGMMNVPHLVNKQTYYYQVRRFTSFNNAPSEWSELKTILPNSGHLYGNIHVNNFKQIGKRLIISINPPKNAKAYKVTYTQNNISKYQLINQGILEFIVLEIEGETKIENVKVESL